MEKKKKPKNISHKNYKTADTVSIGEKYFFVAHIKKSCQNSKFLVALCFFAFLVAFLRFCSYSKTKSLPMRNTCNEKSNFGGRKSKISIDNVLALGYDYNKII